MDEDNLLKALTSGVPLLGVVVLALSVLYDFVFFFAIGLSFAEVPTTLSDHARSAIIWIPILAIFLGVIIYSIGTPRINKMVNIFQGNTTTTADTPALQITKSRKWAYRVLFVISFILILADLIYLKSGHSVLSSIVMVYTVVWMYATKTKSQIVSSIVVFLLIGAAGLGNIMGAIFVKKETKWFIEYVHGPERQTKQIRSIRQFSDVAIILDKDQFVSVIPKNDIRSIEKIEKTVQRPNWACSSFNYRCD